MYEQVLYIYCNWQKNSNIESVEVVIIPQNGIFSRSLIELLKMKVK